MDSIHLGFVLDADRLAINFYSFAQLPLAPGPEEAGRYGLCEGTGSFPTCNRSLGLSRILLGHAPHKRMSVA